MSACVRQHESYAPHALFEGTRPTSSWWNVACDWVTHLDGGPFAILPGGTFFECEPIIDGVFYRRAAPGRCVSVFSAQQECPPSFCSAANPGGSDGGGSSNPVHGNPILLSTGAKYETEEDFATADHRLSIVRHYRSFQSAGAEVNGMNPLGLGAYWRFGFGYELHLQAYPADYTRMGLHLPDGSAYDFRRDTSGALVSTDSDVGQIALLLALDGTWPADLRTLTQNSTRWRLALPDNRVVMLQTFQPYQSTNFTLGRPVTITDRDGYVQTFTYDARGALQTLSDNFGRTLTFTWMVLDPSTYGATNPPRPLAVDRIVFPDGTAVRYSYAMFSAMPTLPMPLPEQLTQVEYLDAAGVVVGTKIYHYEDTRFPWALTGMTDERGVRMATWSYDDQGRAIASEHAGGVDRTTVAYTETTTTATRTVTNPLGKDTVYTFRRSGDGLRLTDATGAPSPNCVGTTRGMTYDSRGFIQTTTDEEGRVTHYTYNDRGLPTQIVEASGTPEARTTTYDWHATWRLPTRITAPQLETTFIYNSNGRLRTLLQTDRATGEARAWSYTYTAKGLLKTVDGPLSGTQDTVTYTYTADGYVKSITNALGQVTTIAATNDRGLPTNILDPNGVRTRLAYDACGRLTRVTVDADGTPTIWRLAYDESGLLTKITRPDSSTLTYAYDNARRLAQVQNKRGEQILYTRDAMGNITKREVTDTAGVIVRTQQQAFDELGRVLSLIGASGQAWHTAYDKTGNPVTGTDPRGHVFASAYDGLNQVIRQTDEDGVPVTLTRTGRGDVATHTDGRNVQTVYARNGWGEITQETSPDTGVTRYVRSALGLVTQKTDGRGVVTDFTYDTTGRMLTKTFPASASENVTYTYDETTGGNEGIGKLTRLTDGTGAIAFLYDAKGRVIQETRAIGGVVYTVQYGYDAAGRIAAITYPSGRIVRYMRDSTGQVTTVTVQSPGAATEVTLASTIRWRPFGPLARLTYGNGLVETRTYDGDDRLIALKVTASGARRINQTYAYGDGINLTAITNLLTAANSEDFAYTPTNRLSDADGPYGTLEVDYDAVGNRTATALTALGGVTAETYATPTGSNRLASVTMGGTVRSFSYDGAGNIIGDTETGLVVVYGYNDAGRLATLTVNGVPTGSYAYNALEQLMARTVTNIAPSGTTYYLHDRDGHALVEATGAGVTAREYVWLGDRPLAVYAFATTPWYVHADHLDRPVMMTDGAKAVVWRAVFLPWGAVHQVTGPATLDMRFPGQWFQLESGLHYNWHRHYDPSTGRYLQPDPLGLVDGPNRYAYALNNPSAHTDSSGLKTYRCKKPLDKLGGSGERSGPDVTGNPLYHQYSCTVRGGTIICDGQTSASGQWGWAGSSGQPSQDSFFEESVCELVQPDNDCYEQCLHDEWAKKRPWYAVGPLGPFGTDCQEYDNNVNNICANKCLLSR